jgi:dTDP-glucose 4,6-dehydratase
LAHQPEENIAGANCVKHLLVTGGAGFIGANFVHHWLRQHPDDRVVVLDALTYAGNRASLAAAESRAAFRFVKGDICDADQVADLMRDERIDCVVHFAAESHVDRSIAGPDEFVRTNVLGTHALLKSARNIWSRNGKIRDDVRFHHVSTDEVYGSLTSNSPAFTETTPYSPNSPYSASKAGSDHLARAYHHTYGLPVTTSNCSNNYGPYQFPEKLIPLMLVHALDGKRLPVYGRGQNVRDWLYVEDHCRAIDVILHRGRVGETYNLGGCNEWRNLDIVQHLCSILDRRFHADPALRGRFPQCPAAAQRPVSELIEFVTDRWGHDWRYAIDARKIESELGFSPDERFETGIEKTVDWYLDNEPWWRSILNGSYQKQASA